MPSKNFLENSVSLLYGQRQVESQIVRNPCPAHLDAITLRTKFIEISGSQHGLIIESIAYKYGKTHKNNRNYWAS